MKPFLEVEATRRMYHADASRNSIHRSSLLAPHIPGARTEVSFLNHFLLKRGITSVGCRITAIDKMGRRIASRLHSVHEPKVYTFTLAEAGETEAENFLIEFFSSENLFIPFSAAMVNHHGANYVNVVHSFNRVLNDVFENDEINSHQQIESAIDVEFDSGKDTFIVFMSGAHAVNGNLSLTYTQGAERKKSVDLPLNLPKLAQKTIQLGEAVPELRTLGPGTLKVQQPDQFLFYGRLMVGRIAKDGGISANHSYYDSSTVNEYWNDSRPAIRHYPFFPALENKVLFYPIMSPGRLKIEIEGFDSDGNSLFHAEPGFVESPAGLPLDISVCKLAESHGVSRSKLVAYSVIAKPTSGNTPTRVNHQIVCGDGTPESLDASVNVSLVHPAIYQPEGKKGYIWGQVVVGDDLDSWLGISGSMPNDASFSVELSLYGSEGRLSQRMLHLNGKGSFVCDVAKEFGAEIGKYVSGRRSNLWFVARSDRADINGFSYSRHTVSRHTTGEHNF